MLFSIVALPTNSVAFIACRLFNGGHCAGSIRMAKLRVPWGWAAISTPCAVQPLSCVWLFVAPWTVGHQASLSFTVSQFAQIHIHRVGDGHPTISSSVVSPQTNQSTSLGLPILGNDC